MLEASTSTTKEHRETPAGNRPSSEHPSPSLAPASPEDQRSATTAESGQADHNPHPLTEGLTKGGNTPQPTNPRAKSTSSSRQEYLDSLQPPSDQDFIRLCSLQEDREREHKRRDNELRHQDKATARKSMEARRDFMKSKALEEERGGERGEENEEQQIHHGSVSSRDSMHQNGDIESLRGKAAMVIQRSYRGYRVRREMQGLGLDAGTRWTHAIRDAQWKELTKPKARDDQPLSAGIKGVNGGGATKSKARRNWIKAATVARRAGGDEDSDHSVSSDYESSSSSDGEGSAQRMSPEALEAARRKKRKAQAKRRKHAQMMGLQYFLEMVDVKHRYGSNLRTYHEEWKRSDTNENYFYWLDYGEGKDVEVASCPRDRLDRERVRYLNREERQHYLVKVDHEGRLVWAKNGLRIDTTEEWKDSIHGIVPIDDPTPAFSPEVENHLQDKAHDAPDHQHHPPDRSSDAGPEPGPSAPSLSSRESELEAARAAKYANTDLDEAKGVGKIKRVSAATVFNKLLRKSVRKNTWIFVADTSFRLYVGIKASGAFQHSSFLQGSRISAAGLIKVKDGRLSSLSPLSGHYRPPASNFRAFVHSLEDEGVDMSHVSISRSYAVLVGLEAYVKTRRKAKEVLRRVSVKKVEVFRPEEARRREEEAWDKSQSAALERRVLELERQREERRREEEKVGGRVLRKLGLRPAISRGKDAGIGNVGGLGGGKEMPEQAQAQAQTRTQETTSTGH